MAAFVAAGADMVLTKPLRIHQLDALLDYMQNHGCQSYPARRLVMNSPFSPTGCHITSAQINDHDEGSSSRHAVTVRPARPIAERAVGFASFMNSARVQGSGIR